MLNLYQTVLLIIKTIVIFIQQLEFGGNIKQFIRYLRIDKRFYVQTTSELIKQALYILKRWMLSYLSYLTICHELPTG